MNSTSKLGRQDNHAVGELEILWDRPTGLHDPEEVLFYGITESMLDGETALFEVLPGIGKSREAATIAKNPPVPMTILTNLQENYGQYEAWCPGTIRLPTKDLCPTLRDDPAFPNTPVAWEAREAYELGWTVSAIHRELDLPCENDGSTCPYRERVKQIDPSGWDPLVGHFTQAYNGQYLDGRAVVIDEGCFTEFVDTINQPVESADAYIDTLDEFPFPQARRPEPGEKEERDRALEILEAEGLEPADHRDSVGEFHARAPLVTYAILGANPMENGVYVCDLPGNRRAVFTNLIEKESDKYSGSIYLFEPPDLSGAEAVIALDATPCLPTWEAVLGVEPTRYRLFDDATRNQYLCEEGYEFIQLNSYVWPASGGRLPLDKCEAILREINAQHDEKPDLITSRAVLGDRDGVEGLKDRGLDHLWDHEMYFGNFQGRNNLDDSELLVVLGSPSRNDRHYAVMAGYLGECALSAIDDDGNPLRGKERDFQNTAANAMLENVRRGETFQAIMRAGRRPGTEATVYIATGMLPEWLDRTKVGNEYADGSFDACRMTRTSNQRAVIEALRGAEGISAGELIDASGVNRKAVEKIRKALQERGLVEKDGKGRWSRYTDVGLESVNPAGDVNLESVNDPIPKSPYNTTIYGSFGIERPDPIRDPRDPSDLPFTEQYPGWMVHTMERVRHRQMDEKLKRADRSTA